MKLLYAVPLVLATWPSFPAAQTTYLVTNTNDGGPGSLRQAIADANAHPGPDFVHFAIPGPGPHTIRPLLELTTVSQPVVIDGTTQPGSVRNTNPASSDLGSNAVLMVELDGSGLGAGGQDGLRILSSDVIVRGLAINRFGVGVRMGPGYTGIVLQGCFVGTDVTGTVAVPNLGSGVIVDGDDCLVGGTSPMARNVLSGNLGNGVLVNGDGVRLQGNLIGTDRSGTRDVGNQDWGVYVGFLSLPQGLVVGGDDPRTRNVISGNGRCGILDNLGRDTLVLGNRIGTDVSGSAALPNGFGGISTDFSIRSTIGGPGAGAGNLISGNAGPGIVITSNSTDTVVQNNAIGPDAAGVSALANPVGILAQQAARIGGLRPGRGNRIAGNGTGVRILGTSGVAVLGNEIGAAAPGSPLANGVGVEIRTGDRNVVLENRIHFNTSDGVRLVAAQRNRIARNSLLGSGRIGIDLGTEGDGPSGVTPNDPGDLDAGPNGLQNFPVLDFALESGAGLLVGGFLSSRPASLYVIELFASPACGVSEHGEGETYLGSRAVTTDGRGLAVFTFTTPNVGGRVVMATATDALGNTSEFSLCRPVLPLRAR